jgi:STE24 endopeptidase
LSAATFSLLFAVALAVSLALKVWLAQRQIAHVASHRDRVPQAFAASIALPAHQKAADYTRDKQRAGIVETLVDTALVAALIFGGGVAMLVSWTQALPLPPIWRDVVMLGALALLSGIVGLPFSWYRTFRIEARYGFNRTTFALWIIDLLKGAAVGVALGLPLLLLILWLMKSAGTWWWLYAWAAWLVFQVGVLLLYPTVIAPWFNRFTPLAAGPVRERIERLLARCRFAARGLFVMDGSRRSGHGNAYFTGFGKSRRIVFFDTLIERLAPEEIEAVLAHELGHFRRRHVQKRIVGSSIAALGFLALLAWLAREPWFYAGLGIGDDTVATAIGRPGVALALFSLALPAFTFLLVPLTSLYSRRHEYEADAFAAQNASPTSLVRALVKLYEDNAATLTPDPLHSAFYDSHPPAALRVAHLVRLGASAETSPQVA